VKLRLIASLFVLAALAVFIASVWVPPYGGGTEQLAQLADPSKAAVSIPAMTSPPVAGHSHFYGRLLNADGQVLQSAKVLAVPVAGASTDQAAACMGILGEEGRFYLELPHGEWELWFAGSRSRQDAGETRLGRYPVGASDSQRQDLKLLGASALLVELQIAGEAGLMLACELLDSTGNVVARGDAVSGSTLLASLSGWARQRFSSGVSVGAAPGTGLCFEGLPAGDYTLRVYLDRDRELSCDRPLSIAAGELLDLGRLTLEPRDFDERLTGARLQPLE
jgi:hypothetical protein